MAVLWFSVRMHIWVWWAEYVLINCWCSGKASSQQQTRFWGSPVTWTFDDILMPLLFKVNHTSHVPSVTLRVWGTGQIVHFFSLQVLYKVGKRWSELWVVQCGQSSDWGALRLFHSYTRWLTGVDSLPDCSCVPWFLCWPLWPQPGSTHLWGCRGLGLWQVSQHKEKASQCLLTYLVKCLVKCADHCLLRKISPQRALLPQRRE